ncbi:TPA: metallophosphoesterase [Vibrio vulnificus]|nr:metallophosphoesterase [Vibrio vulnificus]
MSETYVFRFRDLGKPEGFTIEQHKSLIDNKKGVWWGWWAKSGEVFPAADIGQSIEKEPLSVYLFDSGQSKLYKAVLDNIHSSFSGAKKESSPDTDCTPEYYRLDHLQGWLHFTEIEEVSIDDLLKNYSYMRLDSLYNGNSPDQDEQLFDKFVFSARELIKQDRTIWKVRPKRPGDLEHESLATHYIPHNYLKLLSQKKGSTIVWLSDIHFDRDGAKHNFPFEDTAQHKCLSTRVIEVIDKHSDVDKCAGLLISGDLTWQSQPEGFERAEKFITDISSSQDLSPHDIAICPGNHDVGLVNREEYEDLFGPAKEEDWERSVEEYHTSSKANYVQFYSRIFKRAPEDNLSQGRKFLLEGHKVVEIASVNSCALQQVKNTFQGVGYIGEKQLEDIAQQMEWKGRQKPKSVTRICILHHHLTPVNVSEDAYVDFRYSVTLDAERFMQWVVEHKVDYVLHGHMHKNFTTIITRKKHPLEPEGTNSSEHSFRVVALGSSGVDRENLPGEDASNYVCLIDFSGDKPVFNFHKVDKQSTVKDKAEYRVEG